MHNEFASLSKYVDKLKNINLRIVLKKELNVSANEYQANKTIENVV